MPAETPPAADGAETQASSASVARSEPPSLAAKVCYHFLGFFAFWFGAARFDVDGDGDFDAADVQAMIDQGARVLHLHFSRPRLTKRQRAARRRRNEAKRLAAQAEKEKHEKEHAEILSMNEQKGGVAGAVGNAWENTLHGAEVLAEQVADVAVGAEVEDDLAEEDEIKENLKQHWPYFTIIEVLLILGLWGVCAFQARSYTRISWDHAVTSDFILTPYVKDDGSQLFLDNCQNECNNADSSCVGIAWRPGPFPECLLLSSLPPTTNPSFCSTESWGWRVRVKDAWSPADSLSFQGGAESIWPGHTLLTSHNYCEGGYDISFLWRWWSYQFTHGSLTHVGCNCFMTLILGIPMEGWQGTGMFAIMWTIGVFGGACCWALFDPYRSSCGASGGCYALLGVHVADLIMNWGDKRWRIGTVVVLLVACGVELIGFYATYDPEGGATAHTVHVGGLVAGLLIGIVGGHNAHWKIWEYVILGVGWLVAVCLVGGSLVFWYEVNDFPAIANLWNPSERPWCWIGHVCIGDDGNHCPLLEGANNFATGAGTFDNTLLQCVFCNTRECVESWYTATYTVDGTEKFKYCPQDATTSLCDFSDDWDLFYPPNKSAYQ